ncbi:MAG: hypothetical protein GX020_02310 [Firmicutes bacterium]|nr:hypothetical protein [Bacillota bacterium]
MLADIHEKSQEIPLEYYEDSSLYDRIHRSGQVIASNAFTRFFMDGVVALLGIANVVSVSIVLATFSPWLILLCLFSVLPPFVARLVRGSDYYYLKVYQTPKIRILDYLWSLLVLT